MEKEVHLYMLLLGCTPEGRLTEQHDVFFGIAPNLKDLVGDIKSFWPEAKGKIHIDAWRQITKVDNHIIRIINREEQSHYDDEKLFFLNLGGYRLNEFEEYHCRTLAIAKNTSLAIKQAKKSTFYKHYTIAGAPSHIDEQYGLDVDDIYNIDDLLLPIIKQQYKIVISPCVLPTPEDEIHLGYLTLNKLSQSFI